MSYEYKDTIQDSIIHYYDHVLLYNEYTDDVLKELDHVYAQADKADEYEAKAVAFDRIKAYSDKAINGDIHSLLLAEGIIDVVEQYDINRLSESGESDV